MFTYFAIQNGYVCPFLPIFLLCACFASLAPPCCQQRILPQSGEESENNTDAVKQRNKMSWRHCSMLFDECDFIYPPTSQQHLGANGPWWWWLLFRFIFEVDINSHLFWRHFFSPHSTRSSFFCLQLWSSISSSRIFCNILRCTKSVRSAVFFSF